MKIEKYTPNLVICRIKKGENKNIISDKYNTLIQNIKCNAEGCEEEGDFYLISDINANTHIVKPMENLNAISKKYGVSEESIMCKNNLKTKALFIGQKLRF